MFVCLRTFSQEVNQNQTAKSEKSISPAHSQAERDLDIYKEIQTQAMQKLVHQMKKQVRIEERGDVVAYPDVVFNAT